MREPRSAPILKPVAGDARSLTYAVLFLLLANLAVLVLIAVVGERSISTASGNRVL
jgi:hypothetical protein